MGPLCTGMLGVIALAFGFLFDQILGDSPRGPHPVRWIGRLILLLERPLRRFGGERSGGVVLLGAVTAVVACGTWAVLSLAGRWHPWGQVTAASVLIYYGLAARSLARATQAVLKPSEKGDLMEARQRLSGIVGRDTEDLVSEDINRACIETVAENTSDGVVAPLFYAALAGPVGLWVYKAINTLDSMVGYRNPLYVRFGWASARMDDLANYLPARLTYVLICIIAFLSGRRGRQAFRIGWRDGRKHPSPNSGWPEAAMAGALDVQLGGPSTYGGVLSQKPRLGDPGKPLTIDTVRQAIRLMLWTSWLAFLLAIGCRLALGHLLPSVYERHSGCFSASQ